jgi:hypothetical protein
MKDRMLLAYAARWSLYFDCPLRFQWMPSLFRFQRNGWHLYLWKFRLTRASDKATVAIK